MQYAENDECYQLIQALDEVTNMKILSRIEGDKNKLMNWEQTGCLLDDLATKIQEQFSEIHETYNSNFPAKTERDETEVGQHILLLFLELTQHGSIAKTGTYRFRAIGFLQFV